MKLDAGFDKAALTVLLDVRHPLAYLALHPTLAFAESLALEVDWLPFTVPSLRPPSLAQPGDDRGIRHRRYRAQALAREVETYAEAQGLVVRDFYRDGDVGAASIGWLWVRARQSEHLPAYLAELFRAYWSLELDLSSVEQVANLLERLELDVAGFSAWSEAEGPGAVEALQAEVLEQGLYQVPAYRVEDEVFYGRQHLPMIRWILSGRSGPIPI